MFFMFQFNLVRSLLLTFLWIRKDWRDVITSKLFSKQSHARSQRYPEQKFFFLILASWIRIRKNMRMHGSGSKGENINQKLQKKTFLLLKPNLNFWKKERLWKYPPFWMVQSSFRIKISEKNKTKNLKIIIC